MTRQIWLVRHGPTHAREMIGWTDRPADLSDQAKLARLSAQLPDVPVISSDLCRAIATADALQGNRPRLPHDARLRELHFGAWENRSHADVEATEPALLRAFWDEAGDIAPPGGESWNALRARVSPAIDALPPKAVVVCHFGPILATLQRALGCDVQTVFAHRIEPLSLTEIRLAPGGWEVERINHVS